MTLLALLVEGESLFNDGAAITLFSIVLAAITIGQFSIVDGVLRFLVTVVGALAVGAIIGTLSSLLHAVEDALLALTHEHGQGIIGSLPFERLAQSYRREQGQLEQQLLDLEATTSTQPAANPGRGGTPPADQTAQESQ